MKLEQVQALILLAGFEATDYQPIPNAYWPDHSDYDQVRADNPWWTVQTQHGPLIIGRRKRVWEISWTGIAQIDPDTITQDDVTKGRFLIHAWTLADALKYLTNLRTELTVLKLRGAITGGRA